MGVVDPHRHRGCVPRFVPEVKSKLELGVERVEDELQHPVVALPVLGELEPDGAEPLAEQIRPLLAEGIHVYAYFKHEDEPTAPQYAQRLLELLE